jgi:hypothetical protein
MRCAFRVNVDGRAIFSLPAPSAAIVVEMNMRREKVTDMFRAQSAPWEFAHYIFKHVSWPAVNHDELVWGCFEHRDADNQWSIEMVGVDQVKHGRR